MWAAVRRAVAPQVGDLENCFFIFKWLHLPLLSPRASAAGSGPALKGFPGGATAGSGLRIRPGPNSPDVRAAGGMLAKGSQAVHVSQGRPPRLRKVARSVQAPSVGRLTAGSCRAARDPAAASSRSRAEIDARIQGLDAASGGLGVVAAGSAAAGGPSGARLVDRRVAAAGGRQGCVPRPAARGVRCGLVPRLGTVGGDARGGRIGHRAAGGPRARGDMR